MRAQRMIGAVAARRRKDNARNVSQLVCCRSDDETLRADGGGALSADADADSSDGDEPTLDARCYASLQEFVFCERQQLRAFVAPLPWHEKVQRLHVLSAEPVRSDAFDARASRPFADALPVRKAGGGAARRHRDAPATDSDVDSDAARQSHLSSVLDVAGPQRTARKKMFTVNI